MSDPVRRGWDIDEAGYAGGRGVATACSMWEWGCKRDAGRREGHRRVVARGRDTGGMQQEGGTQEGCSRREGHGMKVEGLWDKGVRMQYEGGTWHKRVGQCRSKQR